MIPTQAPHPSLAAALDEVRRQSGVDHADARLVETEREHVKLHNDDVDRVDRESSEGVNVRVLVRGAWGFGARPGTSPADAVAAAKDALEVARAAARVTRTRVRLAEEEPVRGSWRAPVEEDPFSVPLERKLDDLRAAVSAARAGASREDLRKLRAIEARTLFWREHKWFASSEGSFTEQEKTVGGSGLKVTAADGDEVAVRTWPMDLDGGVTMAGYEAVRFFDLPGHAARLRDEAIALLTAPLCPAGKTTLVLDTPQLALQIHESCGHPTECDRALGEEISLAGASFLTPDKLGRFTYGAPRVNLVADSLRAGGLGTFGWDDEGVPARRTPLVSRGIFVGYLSSRETADKLGLGRSAGCMRAQSWNRPPVIRMINVSLEPDPKGPASLEDLIADTDDGILMGTNRSWSIDDLRLNFQFGCEAAWEIKGGKRTRLFKRPLYTGSTPRFWGGCDAIAGPAAFRQWGFLSCGKGDPMQLMAVGHGCAPARFRNVDVGDLGHMSADDGLLGRDAALTLLHAAVQAALAAGADDAEASLEGGRSGFTRFASSYFTQAGTVVDPLVRVRVALDGRVGAATTSRLEPAGLASAARAALVAARAQSVPAQRLPGFARPDATRTPYPTRFSAATAAAGPDERADVCAQLFARAALAGLVCAGAFKSGVRELAVVTAGGVAVHHLGSEASLELIALDADPTTGASGYAHFHGGDLAGLDVDALADDAVGRAVRARAAIEIEPGPLDVVLDPPAVVELLEWMAMTSFSARSVLDQGSFLTGRTPGEALAAPAVTIVDDGAYAHPALITLPFDAEGVTRVPVDFVRAGGAGRPCSDLATAQMIGAPASTGHASGLTNDISEGAGPAHLVLHPGDASVDEAIGKVERGLHITRFHYVNGLLDTRRATMTGMTRDGTFLIENGKAGTAVRNLRWTESILDALAPARLGGIGRDLRASATTWTRMGQVLAPALLLRGFRFTGRSR